MFETKPRDVRGWALDVSERRGSRGRGNRSDRWSEPGVCRRPVWLRQWVRRRGKELGQ